MDASKEIAEITEAMAIYTAIATLGAEWADYSPAEIDERAREVKYRAGEVIRRREAERELYT